MLFDWLKAKFSIWQPIKVFRQLYFAPQKVNFGGVVCVFVNVAKSVGVWCIVDLRIIRKIKYLIHPSLLGDIFLQL